MTAFQLMLRRNQAINRLDLKKQYPWLPMEELYAMADQELFLERIAEVRGEEKSLSYGEAMDRAAERFPSEYELYLAAVGQIR